MAPADTTRPAPGVSGMRASEGDQQGSSITDTDKPSRWREQFKVHPAADAFPMLEGDELRPSSRSRAYARLVGGRYE